MSKAGRNARRWLKFAPAVAAAVAAGWTPILSHAAPYNWDIAPGAPGIGNGGVTGGTGTWDLGNGNWTADGGANNVAWPNTNTDVAVFGDVGGTVTLGSAITANGLTFDVAGYTVTGNTLTLAGTTPTITVTNPADTATINSVLAGSAGLVAAGPGTLVLGGTNTFTGGVNISGGTLRFGVDANLGAAANTLALGAAGTLSYSGNTGTAARAIALSTAAATDSGAVINVTTAGQTLTISGVISGGPGNAGATTTLGNTALTLTGPGRVALTGVNTFTGNIVVDGGTLQFSNADAQLGATASGTYKSVILQNGGTFNQTTGTYNPTTGANTANKRFAIGTGGGTLDIASGAVLQLDDPDQLTGAGNTLTKVGAGQLHLNAQTYTVGTINLNAGSIRAQGVNTLGTAALTAPLNVASGATLDIQGAMTTGRTISIAGAGLNGVGALNNSSGTVASLTTAVFLTGDASVGATAPAGSITVPSLDGSGAAPTITKVGTGLFTITGAGTNFTGTTTVNVNAGLLSAGNQSAFGSNANVTVSSLPGATVLSGYQQIGAALPGYTYTVQPNSVLSGNAAFFNSLVVGTNINLLPTVVAETAAGQNAAAATSFGFTNDASRLFGIGAAVTGENVTVGAGTPWHGIGNDGSNGRSFAGTINANSDFSIRGVNGTTFGIGAVTLTPASPRTVTVSEGTVQFTSAASAYNGNVTIEVATGATIQPTVPTAFGTSPTPANNAAINVLSGGAFNPNGGVAVNNTVTIQPGGILNIDDGNNLAGTGSYIQFPGSVTRITANGATALGGAMSPGTVPGSIVRLAADGITSLPSKIDNAAIFVAFGATRILPTGTTAAPSLAVNSTGSNVTIGAYTNVPTGVITNDNASRTINNASTTTASVIAVGANGATFVATDGTTLTLGGTGANPSNGTLAIEGGSATINIGVPSPTNIDGFAKGGSNGTVVFSGPAATGGNAGFRAGAVNVLSGTFTHNGGGVPFQLGGDGTYGSNTGVGLLTASPGTTVLITTGVLIDAQMNLLPGSTGRFQGGTDNTVNSHLLSGLQGGGNLILGGSGGTNRDSQLTVGSNNLSSTFSGVISNNSATNQGRIVKAGTGTLTLTGNSTYDLGTTISAGTLQLGDGGTSGSVAGAITNNAALVLNRSDLFTLPGVISGTGTLTKNGSGTATLSAAPTYTGATTVNAGGLTIAAGAAMPTTNLTVNNGGRFSYTPASNGTLNVAGPITLADGAQIGFSFGSTINTNGIATAGGTIGLFATGTPTTGTTYNILTGGAGSNLDAAGYVLLNPTNYTYTINETPTLISITTTAATALMQAHWKGGFGNGSWAASDGSTTSNFTTDAAGAVPTPLTPGATTTVTYSATGATGQTSHALGANVSVLGIVSNDTGAVNLTNDGNALTIGAGGITRAAGAGNLTIGTTVVVGGNQSWTNNNAAGSLTVGSTGTAVSVGAGTLTLAGAGGTNVAGNVTLSTGTLTVNTGGPTNITGAVTASGVAPINVSGAGDTTFAGNVNAPGSNLTKTGAGTLTFGGSDNFLQQLNLNVAGVVDIGSGNLTINNAGGNTIQSSITSGTVTINATGGGSIVMVSGGAAPPDNGVANGGTMVINARVTGPGAFEFWRSGVTTGTIVLTNPNNNFADQLVVNLGIVSAGVINNAGVAGNIGAGSTISLGGGTFRYTGAGETTNRVLNLSGTTSAGVLEHDGTGLLRFTSNLTATGAGIKTLTLAGSNTGVGDLAGAIINNSATNTTALTKTGTNTWVLSGNSTYTGATAVNAGRLLINGSIVSNTTVASGATVGGSGTIGGALTITSGGTLAPGNSPGILTLTGALTLNAGSTYEVEVGGGLPGNGSANYDQTNTTASAGTPVTLGGRLSVSSFNGYATDPGSNPNLALFVLTQAGSSAVSGLFVDPTTSAAVPQDGTIFFPDGVGSASITYTANWTGNAATSTLTGGNDVALYNVTLVPEPTTAALAGIAAVGLLSRRRRRQSSTT